MTLQKITGAETHGATLSPDGGASAAITADVMLGDRVAARGVSNRTMEIGTSLAFAAAGAIAMWDSARVGAGWAADGPQSGYFPFWIGVLLVLAAIGNLVAVARTRAPEGEGEAPLFLSWEQARTVATVFIPTTVFVVAIPFTGIYLASAALVAWFMMRLGGFSATRSVPAGIATALVTFMIFEIWFLLALPKGPVETFLGY